PPAVAQRYGHGALGVALADDEAVKLGYDLARGEVGHGCSASGGRRFLPGNAGSARIKAPRRSVHQLPRPVTMAPRISSRRAMDPVLSPIRRAQTSSTAR